MAKGRKAAAEALREVPLFACLNDKELRRIADLARNARFAPGEDIITEGHSSGPFFLLTEGDALVIVGGAERGKLGPGDFFGEMSLLDGQPRSATIRAIGDVRALAISSWDFLALLERNWSMTHKLLVDITHRVRVLDENPLPLKIDFNSSAGSSLGVEVELEIVDHDTRELRSAASEILPLMGEGHPNGEHPKAKHELLESTVEIITGICSNVAQARRDLEGTLAELQEHTGPRGLAVMCSGSHPFSDWADQEVSPDPRYARLVEEMQWTARRLQIFGIHVHVGIKSAEKAIAIANALSAYIPHFLALSASSPYWMGRDTGLASARSKVFEGLPTAGLPYQLSGWDEFEQFMQTLVSANAIQSIREVWWDIRPHPDFGTVELRICDGIPTFSEIAAVAALSQCLVEWMDSLMDRGYSLPMPRGWVVRENKWRAARHGIHAEVIVGDSGDNVVPLCTALHDLVEELSPVAERLDCIKELRHCLTILDDGPSYLRQRAVVEKGGTLPDVVDSLIREMETDEPSG